MRGLEHPILANVRTDAFGRHHRTIDVTASHAFSGPRVFPDQDHFQTRLKQGKITSSEQEMPAPERVNVWKSLQTPTTSGSVWMKWNCAIRDMRAAHGQHGWLEPAPAICLSVKTGHSCSSSLAESRLQGPDFPVDYRVGKWNRRIGLMNFEG